jgi:hypothetical protein
MSTGFVTGESVYSHDRMEEPPDPISKRISTDYTSLVKYRMYFCCSWIFTLTHSVMLRPINEVAEDAALFIYLQP